MRVHIKSETARADIAQRLSTLLEELNTDNRPLAILCVGTDRSIGDSLGPLVGHMLSACDSTNARIVGTLDNPVHATNLHKTLDRLARASPKPFIVAVDASLGTSEQVETINITPGPLRPGAGVNKSLPTVGDICVTGAVNVGGFMEQFTLQHTRLSLIMRMADVMAGGMAAGIQDYHMRNEAAAAACPMLYDARPTCKHELVERQGGGVNCIICGGWFCY